MKHVETELKDVEIALKDVERALKNVETALKDVEIALKTGDSTEGCRDKDVEIALKDAMKIMFMKIVKIMRLVKMMKIRLTVKEIVKFGTIVISIMRIMHMTMLIKSHGIPYRNVQLLCLLSLQASGEIPYFRYTHCVN